MYLHSWLAGKEDTSKSFTASHMILITSLQESQIESTCNTRGEPSFKGDNVEGTLTKELSTTKTTNPNYKDNNRVSKYRPIRVERLTSTNKS